MRIFFLVAADTDARKENRTAVGLVSCERTAWHGRGGGCRPPPRRPPRRRRRRLCLSSYDYRPLHVYDKSCSQAVRRLSHSLLQPGLTRCAARMHHRTIRFPRERATPPQSHPEDGSSVFAFASEARSLFRLSRTDARPPLRIRTSD